MADSSNLFDLVALILALALLFAYNIYAYSKTLSYVCCKKPNDDNIKLQLHRNWATSYLWMQKHAQKNDAPTVTLAIQTFRNTILVATFLGTITFQSAITICNGYNLANDDYQRTRIIILVVLLFASFLSWSSVIRCAAHLGYQTGVLSDNIEKKTKESKSAAPVDVELAIQANRIQKDDEEEKLMSTLFENESHLMLVMLLSFRYSKLYFLFHYLKMTI